MRWMLSDKIYWCFLFLDSNQDFIENYLFQKHRLKINRPIEPFFSFALLLLLRSIKFYFFFMVLYSINSNIVSVTTKIVFNIKIKYILQIFNFLNDFDGKWLCKRSVHLFSAHVFVIIIQIIIHYDVRWLDYCCNVEICVRVHSMFDSTKRLFITPLN